MHKSPNEGVVSGSTEQLKVKNPSQSSYFPWASLIDSVTLIPLQTNAESLISEVTKIEVLDDRVIVYDLRQRCVFLFTVNGKFLAKFSVGEGPEELREPRDFCVDRKAGLIHVLSFNEIGIYDLNGAFVKKRYFDFMKNDFFISPLEFGIAADNGYYFWNGTFGIKKFDYNKAFLCYKVNSDLKEIEKKYFLAKRELLESTRFRSWSGGYFLSPSVLSDTLFELNPKDDLAVPRYTIDFGDKSLIKNKSEFDKPGADEGGIVYKMSNDSPYCGFVTSISVSDEYVYFTYYCSKNRFQALYNKATGEVINGQAYGFDEIIKKIQVKAFYDNKIVFYFEMPELKGYYNDYLKTSKKDLPIYQKKILEFAKSADEGGNPVICIASLRNK